MKLDKSEIFPLVDEKGNVVGSASRGECHSGSMLLHPVVHLHIFNHALSAILLQKRSMDKDIQPGKWDTAVGGHVDFGESVGDALLRETREELGFVPQDVKNVVRYIFQSTREREMVNVFATVVDPLSFVPVAAPDEIDEVRFWTITDVQRNIGKGIFTPNFEQEFVRISPLIKKLWEQ